MLQEFLYNLSHNLFKPLLLFFYAGFLIPILGVKFEYPKALYQSLTIYLLLAIGWHGGEELATLEGSMLGQALGFMLIGFVTNLCIGLVAYQVLCWTTRLRRIDAATVAGYYGSDSAGTFVTCMGVLAAANIASSAFMPVMLAVMEIPGCLVALYIVSRLRSQGMDRNGTMPDEPGYVAAGQARSLARVTQAVAAGETLETAVVAVGAAEDEESYAVETSQGGHVRSHRGDRTPSRHERSFNGREGHPPGYTNPEEHRKADELEATLALESLDVEDAPHPVKSKSIFNRELLHEVFLNPGIFLLFGGIAIGFISRLQGTKVTAADDQLFVNLFQGILCLFLLEMGMTASQKLRDLRTAGWPFVAFGLIAPNVFATSGIFIAHAYSMCLGQPFELGTYVLFAVLCGAASYIAVPAVQRLAIPEASPTLPLAASLGLTFSYNVTIGIPLYLMIAKAVTTSFPIAAA